MNIAYFHHNALEALPLRQLSRKDRHLQHVWRLNNFSRMTVPTRSPAAAKEIIFLESPRGLLRARALPSFI